MSVETMGEASQDASPRGDCFVVAAHFVIQHAQKARSVVTLCHGIIVGQGPIEGVRHWHAWAEVTVTEKRNGFTTSTRYAVDMSNGKAVVEPARSYRALARAERVWEYTPVEARERMLDTEHYGPWEGDDGSLP